MCNVLACNARRRCRRHENLRVRRARARERNTFKRHIRETLSNSENVMNPCGKTCKPVVACSLESGACGASVVTKDEEK